MTFLDGNIYEDEFKNGQPCGKGKVIFKDGNIYEGEFHGEKGKFALADGSVYEVELKKNGDFGSKYSKHSKAKDLPPKTAKVDSVVSPKCGSVNFNDKWANVLAVVEAEEENEKAKAKAKIDATNAKIEALKTKTDTAFKPKAKVEDQQPTKVKPDANKDKTENTKFMPGVNVTPNVTPIVQSKIDQLESKFTKKYGIKIIKSEKYSNQAELLMDPFLPQYLNKNHEVFLAVQEGSNKVIGYVAAKIQSDSLDVPIWAFATEDKKAMEGLLLKAMEKARELGKKILSVEIEYIYYDEWDDSRTNQPIQDFTNPYVKMKVFPEIQNTISKLGPDGDSVKEGSGTFRRKIEYYVTDFQYNKALEKIL